jgi:hypothetical protein
MVMMRGAEPVSGGIDPYHAVVARDSTVHRTGGGYCLVLCPMPISQAKAAPEWITNFAALPALKKWAAGVRGNQD